ncbi:aldo/keto reductase [Actinopolymorpha alba]|uniref:aldo/keto reductase n=1 Tax=Actinopolymorpha alba TaxID=533267 RepID=UPI0003611081|nr:aldo/keto reductase [Actinopolymorpha alba]
MEYSLLGPSGVRVSKVCIGTATFGVAPTAEDADRVVHAALDHGINFFDTANAYGNLAHFDRPGMPTWEQREPAEEILGRALRGRRDEVILATKSRERIGPGVNDLGLSRRHVMAQLENSLRRLGTDYVDIYYAHHPDPDTPLEQTLRAFDDMVRQGKVRYVALSTYPAWEMTHALWICGERNLHAPICAQVRYNLLDRSPEAEVVPACLRFGLSLVTFSSLHGGLLAGLDVAAREVSGWKRWGGQGFSEEELRVARKLEKVSAEWGVRPHHLALVWLWSRPVVASAIIGPETAAEVTANAAAVDVTLDSEQLAVLEALGR